jgi:hypothetical protein
MGHTCACHKRVSLGTLPAHGGKRSTSHLLTFESLHSLFDQVASNIQAHQDICLHQRTTTTPNTATNQSFPESPCLRGHSYTSCSGGASELPQTPRFTPVKCRSSHGCTSHFCFGRCNADPPKCPRSGPKEEGTDQYALDGGGRTETQDDARRGSQLERDCQGSSRWSTVY